MEYLPYQLVQDVLHQQYRIIYPSLASDFRDSGPLSRISFSQRKQDECSNCKREKRSWLKTRWQKNGKNTSWWLIPVQFYLAMMRVQHESKLKPNATIQLRQSLAASTAKRAKNRNPLKKVCLFPLPLHPWGWHTYLNIYHKNEAHICKYTSPMYPIQALLSHVPREPWLFDTTPRISAAFSKCCNTRLGFHHRGAARVFPRAFSSAKMAPIRRRAVGFFLPSNPTWRAKDLQKIN